MSEKNLSLGDRLALERKRMDLDQERLGALLGRSRRTISAWENGAQSPPAADLMAMAVRGFDVLFLLTGQRSADTVGKLTSEETALVDNYRHATEKGRAAARAVLDAFEKPTPSRGRRKAAGDESD